MRFADFHAGQRLVVDPYVLDEATLLDFARQWDPQWFHTDPEAAARGPYSGLIASGWQTCAIAMRLVVEHLLSGSESCGSPGLTSVQWPAPVRAGDALTLTVDVLEARRSRRDHGRGVLRWRWQLHDAQARQVLSPEAVSLFDLTSTKAAEGAGHPEDD